MNLMVQALRRRQRDTQARVDKGDASFSADLYSTRRSMVRRAGGAISSIVLWGAGLSLAFLVIAGLVMYYMPRFLTAPPPILPPGFPAQGMGSSTAATPASVAMGPAAPAVSPTHPSNPPTSTASAPPAPPPSAQGSWGSAPVEPAGRVQASPPVAPVRSAAVQPGPTAAATPPTAVAKEPSKAPLPEVSTKFVARPVAAPPDAAAVSKEPKKATSAKEPSGPRLTKVPPNGGVEAAWKALAAGQLDEAELLYAKVLSEQPNHVDALVGLAHVLHRRGQREAALQTYRLALSHAPDNATALSGSLALMSEADPATAESRLKDYLESRPQDDAVHVALGQTLGRQGRWSEAQASFFKAHTLQPQSAVNAYNLAVSLDHLHQYGQALKFYRAAVAASRQGDIPMESALKRIDVLARELSQP